METAQVESADKHETSSWLPHRVLAILVVTAKIRPLPRAQIAKIETEINTD